MGKKFFADAVKYLEMRSCEIALVAPSPRLVSLLETEDADIEEMARDWSDAAASPGT